MPYDEFKAIQDEIDRRRENLKKKLEAIKQEELQIECDQAALATVINMAKRQGINTSSSDEHFTEEHVRSRPLVRFIDEAIQVLPLERFSMDDIVNYITSKYPREFLRFNLEKSKPNISRHLSTMADNGALLMVKAPSGRRPAKYVRMLHR